MKTVISKKFDSIDWLEHINSIEVMPSIKDACVRYEKDLVSIISKNRKFKKPPVLMLSGGVDSMMLGTVLKKHFGLQQTFSFASVIDTHDAQQSQRSAKSLGVDNELIVITFDEIVANLNLIQGKNIDSVNSVLAYLMFYLGLKKAKVDSVDVLNGDGADTLLGSLKSFMYIDTPYIMKKYNVSKDVARTACKMRFYSLATNPNVKRGTGASHLIIEAIQENNCNAILPFKHKDKLEWVNRLLYSFANDRAYPKNKHLHKEFISYMGNYDNSQERTVMQIGTGIYEKLKDYLNSKYKTKTPNTAVKQIVSSTSTLPI
jgi:asparagine synthetase B (glutamine-hydrolysing)